MLTVETRHAIHQDHAKTMDTDALASALLDARNVRGW